MPTEPRASVKIIDGSRPRATVPAKPQGGGLFGCLFALALLCGFGLSIIGSLYLIALMIAHWPL